MPTYDADTDPQASMATISPWKFAALRNAYVEDLAALIEQANYAACKAPVHHAGGIGATWKWSDGAQGVQGDAVEGEDYSYDGSIWFHEDEQSVRFSGVMKCATGRQWRMRLYLRPNEGNTVGEVLSATLLFDDTTNDTPQVATFACPGLNGASYRWFYRVRLERLAGTGEPTLVSWSVDEAEFDAEDLPVPTLEECPLPAASAYSIEATSSYVPRIYIPSLPEFRSLAAFTIAFSYYDYHGDSGTNRNILFAVDHRVVISVIDGATLSVVIYGSGGAGSASVLDVVGTPGSEDGPTKVQHAVAVFVGGTRLTLFVQDAERAESTTSIPTALQPYTAPYNTDEASIGSHPQTGWEAQGDAAIARLALWTTAATDDQALEILAALRTNFGLDTTTLGAPTRMWTFDETLEAAYGADDWTEDGGMASYVDLEDQ